MENDFNPKTTLHLLDEIERNEFRSQRSFASRFDIAVGLANAYIKRCVKKGWIKMRRAPARRYVYYLTPKGFAEKARLTGEYLARSFQFFREARLQCLALLRHCEREGLQKVALYGGGELAEIAAISAWETDVKLIGLVSPDSGTGDCAGLRVYRDLEELGEFDALIITDISNPQRIYDELKGRIAKDRLLVPPMLFISPFITRR